MKKLGSQQGLEAMASKAFVCAPPMATPGDLSLRMQEVTPGYDTRSRGSGPYTLTAR